MIVSVSYKLLGRASPRKTSPTRLLSRTRAAEVQKRLHESAVSNIRDVSIFDLKSSILVRS